MVNNEFNKNADGKITKKAQQVMNDLDAYVNAFETNKSRKPERLILTASQIIDLWSPKYMRDKYWRNIPVISQREAEREN